MSGLTYLVWYVCTIAFFPLLAYAVVKRPLWVPGLVVMSYANVGMARLSIPMVGTLRGYLLIALASIILISSALMKRQKRQKVAYVRLSFADQAPVFLLVLLFLMFLRLPFDYISSGRLFYPNEITASLIGTFLPLLILIVYPPQDDAFPEVLRGIGIGSALSVLPAFTDFETLKYIVENLIGGGTLAFQKIQFKDRNTIAFFAFHAAISLFYLNVMGYMRRLNKFSYMISGLLIVFAFLNQSRRWFLGFLCFAVFYYLYWIKYKKGTSRTSTGVMVLKIIPSIAVLIVGIYLVYDIQSRFERYEITSMAAELGPSIPNVTGSYSRADIMKEAFEVFKEYPILGSGMLVFGWEEITYEGRTGEPLSGHIGAHNLVMDILVQYGIVGGFCASIFFIAVFYSLKKWGKKGRTLQFKKELSLTSMYWISLLVVAFAGGVDPHNLGLIALLPAVMRLLIAVEAKKISVGQHQWSQKR